MADDGGVSVSAGFTPGPSGSDSLRKLGIDHFHMEEWECTYNYDQLDLLEDDIVESSEPWKPHKVYTLVEGPTLFAARVPTDVDEHGDVHDCELRLFASEDDANAAIAKARGETAPHTLKEESGERA